MQPSASPSPHSYAPASKTDPLRQGIRLTAAAADDDACAVRALRHLFKRRAPDGPLFQLADGSFVRDAVTSQLYKTLISLGTEDHYAGHSFCRGTTTSAREAGFGNKEIRLLGRWKSDSYRLYIVTHPTHVLVASRRHQHLPPYQRLYRQESTTRPSPSTQTSLESRLSAGVRHAACRGLLQLP